MPDCPCEPSDGQDTAPRLGREIFHRMPAEGGMGIDGEESALTALGETSSEGRSYPCVCFSHMFPERWGSPPSLLLADVIQELCKQP